MERKIISKSNAKLHDKKEKEMKNKEVGCELRC